MSKVWELPPEENLRSWGKERTLDILNALRPENVRK
jgi:hypothetical protein